MTERDEGVDTGPTEERKASTLEARTLVDHFRILRRVGTGGMGEVYLARDINLGRLVALKMIHSSLLDSESAVQQFVVEARITARFNHPHIVTVYAVGEYEGRPYLALEFLEGQTLGQRLREDRPGLRESLRIVLAVAEALKEAHRNQVLHWDLKPANVLIPRDGRIRVVDFGISKMVSSKSLLRPGALRKPLGDPTPIASAHAEAPAFAEPSPTEALTDGLTLAQSPESTSSDATSGMVVGTPRYLSPERWQGKESTEAADIWALGILLYQLVSGHHPYQGLSRSALREQVTSTEPVPLISPRYEVTPEVQMLLKWCLDKVPTSRPSAEAVVDELRENLPSRRSRRTTGHSPFRGLRAFEERHTDQFFGRDAEVLAFLERLRQTPILPVVGASGAGKSSFVQAGVIPRLREQGAWLVIRLRPGTSPFEALSTALLLEETSAKFTVHDPADATIPMDAPDVSAMKRVHEDGGSTPLRRLAGDKQSLPTQLAESPATLNLLLHNLADQTSSKVLLFVDQLEELYTLVEDAEVRRRFMQALCAAADDRLGPVRVIFTLREDFLSRLAEGSEAREILSHVTVMRSPGAEALEEILVKPLEGTGHGYEDPDLVKDLVREVRHEPACLPLLAFAARTLWERRDPKRKLLLRSAYDAMGGVAGALAEHADGVLQGLSAKQVQSTRQILLRLVTSEGTRQGATRQQVLEGLGNEAAEVLVRLTEARLISARKGRGSDWGSATLELVHEALIQRWTQLAHWLDESREDLVFLAEVGQAADLWEKRDRPVAEVWHGEALAEAERKAGRCQNVPRRVRDFLGAGLQRAQRQTRRRRFGWAAAMTLLAVVALASVGISVMVSREKREALVQRAEALVQRTEAQRQRAEAQRQRAEAQRQRAEAQQAGARAALARGDLHEARARLRVALETGDSRLARSLWWQLEKLPLVWKKKLGAVVYHVAFSPDGKKVAAACMDRTVTLFDVQTGGVRILRGYTDQVLAVAFSPDSQRLVSGSWGGEIRIWDLESGRSRTLVAHTRAVYSVAFSPTGTLLASGSDDRTIRLWDVKSGREKAVLRGHKNGVQSISFSPSGTLLASGSNDRTIRLWDVKSGREKAVIKGHKDVVLGVSFSPDGALLASGSVDKTVRLWDVKSGREKAVLRGHKARVVCVSFSPDGERLASGSADKTVRLWDVKSGRETMVLKGHQASVQGISFSPGGTLLASGSHDKTVRLWNVKDGREKAAYRGHQASVVGLSFSPGGALLASGSADKTVRLWDVKTGRETAVLRGHRARIRGLSFSPGGTLLASGSDDKTIRLWDVKSWRETAVFRGHTDDVRIVSFSPGGTMLASGSEDKTVRLWDVKSGREKAVLRGHEAGVQGVAFSPDETLLASASTDGTVRLWDAKTGRETAVLRGHKARVWSVAFSPDGTLLASASTDGTVRLWNVKTRKGRILGQNAGRIYWVHFHPDGTRVGAPSSDGLARIWDLDTGKCLELRGHRAEVNAFRFSPDGKLAATASDDGTIRLWETDTGRPFWRAPLLRHRTLELFTHGGWLSISGQRKPGGQPNPARWRTAVERTAHVAAESPDGKLLCLGTLGTPPTSVETLELWDLTSDRRLAIAKVPNLTEVTALPNACVTLAQGIARLHDRAGLSQVLHRQAAAAAWDDDTRELLVAAGRRVWMHGPHGKTRGYFPTDVGATAIGRVGGWIAVGFQDGNIELVPTLPGQTKPIFTFEGVPSSPVVRIIPGPRSTLLAGYANGMLGLWSLQNGALLKHARLHGPVDHLLIKGTRLYAATGLGQHLTWDLGMFHLPYCELLRRIWAKVPIIWDSGLPVFRPPPREHRCKDAQKQMGRGSSQSHK